MESEIRAQMRAFIEKYHLLNRVPVSDDTSRLVHDLAQETGASVLAIPSGTECLTWVVPPKWVVREAYLETLNGERIADFQRHPLYLKSYSAPFSGEVSRETLFNHILSDEARPDRLLYDYRAQYEFGEKTQWGFSLPHRVAQTLNDSAYRVHIDTAFEQGTLHILDWTLPGASSDTIFFAAHTCHTAQVNDGLAGIAVIRALFNHLAQQSFRRYTYRAIFGPEYFAAAGLLAYGEGIADLKCGFFLDMPGNGKPLGFSRSYHGDTTADRVAHNVFKKHFGTFIDMPYRGLWGNDEMFYDGPDFQIPTIGVGRDRFLEYHTDHDDIAHCDFAQLEETLRVLRDMVQVLETDCVVRRTYRGPLYLSRYGIGSASANGQRSATPLLSLDKGRSFGRTVQAVQILMDGKRTCLDIAHTLDLDYHFVHAFAGELQRHGLAVLEQPLPLGESR